MAASPDAQFFRFVGDSCPIGIFVKLGHSRQIVLTDFCGETAAVINQQREDTAQIVAGPALERLVKRGSPPNAVAKDAFVIGEGKTNGAAEIVTEAPEIFAVGKVEIQLDGLRIHQIHDAAIEPYGRLQIKLHDEPIALRRGPLHRSRTR